MWPDNPASFRRRWDDVMKAIGVPVSGALGLTPGSLRGGGAVALFETTGDLALVQWRLRLENQQTLCHYLQEVVAQQVWVQLSDKTKKLVVRAAREAQGLLASSLRREFLAQAALLSHPAGRRIRC